MSHTASVTTIGRSQFQGIFDTVAHIDGMVNFDSAASNTTVSEDIVAPGVKLGDLCLVSVELDTTQGGVLWGYVVGTDTVRLNLHNVGGTPLDLAEAHFHVVVLRIHA